MQIVVQNSSGDNVDTITVSDNLFDSPMNQALVHQVAVAHMANARQGTSSTKTRGMVSGGGAKPWRQKHTGRARQGSRTAPHWRGGGVVFGPHPRDYSQKIPKKMKTSKILLILSFGKQRNRMNPFGKVLGVKGDLVGTSSVQPWSFTTLAPKSIFMEADRT